MAASNYDTEKLESALNNISLLENKVSSLVDDISKVKSLDSRLIEYYNNEINYFNDINSSKNDLIKSQDELVSFRVWLSNAITSLNKTIAETEETSNQNKVYDGSAEHNNVNSTVQAVTGLETAAVSSDVSSTTNTSTDVDKKKDEELKDDVTSSNKTTEEAQKLREDEIRDAYNSLSPEEQAAINTTLQNVTDGDIEKAIVEAAAISPVLIESIALLLQSIYRTNPDVRGYIKSKYGVDVFDDNGNVNTALLSLLVLSDLNDSELNIIQDLEGVFGITIDNVESVDNLANLFEEALRKFPELRQLIIDKYGFDIFDENGNIDVEKLKMLLAIDAISSSDDYDVYKILQEALGINIYELYSIDDIARLLEILLAENPELRQLIKDKYGFDIYDENGNIDITKLRMLLLLDSLDINDKYNILKLIQDEINVDTFEINNIYETAKLLEDLLELNPDLRQFLIDKYGFDIFNEDGTVNLEKLRLALILDNVNGEKVTLLSLLGDKYNFTIPSDSDIDAYDVFLAKLLKLNPNLRDLIIEKYGFDIFNEDGSINMDKLKLALMIDDLNTDDEYDILELLSKAYNLKMPSMDELNSLVNLLQDLIKNNPDLRDYLIKKYGFDIFNEDGSININKLRLALLLDQIDNDDFDLFKYLSDQKNINTNVNQNEENTVVVPINTNNTNTNKINTKKKKNTSVNKVNLEKINTEENNQTNEVIIEEPEIEEPIVEEYVEPEIVNEDTNYYEDPLNEVEDDNKPNKKKNKNILGIAAGIGLAAGAASYGAYKLSKKKDEEDDEDEGYEYEE